ncbi:alkaline phosphatase D [Tamaricihabitans halophyticus]|uniref:Alkaline phosphatase D n=1 Tax=Tamaricihabitans halophyticus TaxID=1262583 RepID=A0A4R2R1H1_9PSEU|nr:alkaline phosphatase D family protein [Tamaricihabitans halophyticus]TCP53265.1 alkaline phosphatase D [Tamaricihabitans halophyticus]
MPEQFPTTNSVSRRSVLLGGAAALGAASLGGSDIARAATTRGAGRAAKLGPYFNLGVASGDPLPDGFVLWTRLAPNPTAEDGLGGMPDKTVPVDWELATDEKFANIVRKNTVDAVPDSAHSVHVELDGLDPGTEYFYRFRAEGNYSDVGRTRTAPAAGTMGDLTVCFASCAHYGEGLFTAYRRIAEDQPGLILHLGDYQYEYEGKSEDIRDVLGPETVSLANYRQRHAQYKTDLDLQAAHAIAPWLVVFDDHEVENNWADEIPEDGSQTPGEDFLARRTAALQAYYENMPLRSSAKPSGKDMKLYRRYSWGGLATFHMLDTRQYRSDQACDDGWNDVSSGSCKEEWEDQSRTLTGTDQREWLLDGFNNSSARWDVLGQQVFFAQRERGKGNGSELHMDGWDGYPSDQDAILAAMGNSKVRNGVVFTGDVHRHYAGELKENYDDPDSPNLGVELVTTSVTSGGNGGDDTNDEIMQANPHLKFYKNRRGYVRTKFTEGELRADFRVLSSVTSEGAEATTEQTFVVNDGEHKLNPT